MKNQDQILTELNTIFQSVFRDTSLKVVPATTADDIRGWDSLTHMNLIAEIEKHFSCEFRFDEVMDFQNVGDMVESIRQKQ
jgi:acyl carrier protein